MMKVQTRNFGFVPAARINAITPKATGDFSLALSTGKVFPLAADEMEQFKPAVGEYLVWLGSNDFRFFDPKIFNHLFEVVETQAA